MAHEPKMRHIKEALNVNETEDRLATIMRLQREFQEVILGHGNMSTLDPKARADYFRTQCLSLMFELGEAGNEIAWKPWATSTHFNWKAYASEIIDAFHFLLNLAFLADMSADELYDGYLKKQARNRERQIEGYDGVTGKCPGCRRSYDDAGVLCRPAVACRCGASFIRSDGLLYRENNADLHVLGCDEQAMSVYCAIMYPRETP